MLHAHEIARVLEARPTRGVELPVIAKTDARGVIFLGGAQTHAEAELLGLAEGVSCQRVSRASVNIGGRQAPFFVLH